MLTENEKRVARAVQGHIPAEQRPFRSLGDSLGMSEADVLAIIRDLSYRGIIRKFGAVLRHTKAGVTTNIMVVWAVPEDDTAVVGERLASYGEVTHCYERTPPFEGKYNLFSMIHFRDENVNTRLRKIADEVGISDYITLPTVEEFKKVSMGYFT
jgi:DNA-binding Lrp family transcriptional regulator